MRRCPHRLLEWFPTCSTNPSTVLLQWCQTTGHTPKDVRQNAEAGGEQVCFDSSADNTWASVPFGIFLSTIAPRPSEHGSSCGFVQSVVGQVDTGEHSENVGRERKAKHSSATWFRRKDGCGCKQRYGGAAGKRYKKIEADPANAQTVHDCLHTLFPAESAQEEDDFFSSMGAEPAAPAPTQLQSIGERRAAAAAAKAEALAAAAQRKQEAELAAAEAQKERVAAAAAAMTADADAGWDAPAPSAKPKTKIRMGAKKTGELAALAAARCLTRSLLPPSSVAV